MITLNQSYTYEELLRNLQESGTQYPESTIYKKVGESHDERPIPMLRVGSGLDTLILTAGIHGKESLPYNCQTITPPVFSAIFPFSAE